MTTHVKESVCGAEIAATSAPRPVTPAIFRGRVAPDAPSALDTVQARRPPVIHMLTKCFGLWRLRWSDGRITERPHLLELVETLPCPRPNGERHYIVTREKAALEHNELIEWATGWVVTEPLSYELYARYVEYQETTSRVLVASDASRYPKSPYGAVAYAIFDGESIVVAARNVRQDIGGPPSRMRPIDRLETIAAIEGFCTAAVQVPHAGMILGLDSSQAKQFLLDSSRLPHDQAEANLWKFLNPRLVSPLNPSKISVHAGELRERIRRNQVQVTWVPAHSVNHSDSKPQNLSRVRELPEPMLLQELNVVADQAARALNSTQKRGDNHKAACRSGLAQLIEKRFPGAHITIRV